MSESKRPSQAALGLKRTGSYFMVDPKDPGSEELAEFIKCNPRNRDSLGSTFFMSAGDIQAEIAYALKSSKNPAIDQYQDALIALEERYLARNPEP